MATPARILMLLDTQMTWSHGIAQGVISYAKHHRQWDLVLLDPVEEHFAELGHLRPDGVIARVHRPELLEHIQRFDGPWVNTSAMLQPAPLPRVATDELAVGRQAAEYFLDRGFTHFAWAGPRDTTFSQERLDGFLRHLHSQGYTCHVCPKELTEAWPPADLARLGDQRTVLADWLAGLPSPVAVLAPNDQTALDVLAAARQRELPVPERLAVLGVDDDPVLCALAEPALSSIPLPARQAGLAAANLLDRMLGGERAPSEPIRIPPLGVTSRHSTDVLAIGDKHLARALRFIRRNVAQRINVTDVLRKVPLSRRVLENRFRQRLGRSPLEEIHRVQITTARRLLSGTDLPVATVAQLSGFRDARHMASRFRQATGVTPSQFRKRHQPG